MRIDVDQLLQEREEERQAAVLATAAPKLSSPSKSKKTANKKTIIKKENVEEVLLSAVPTKASGPRKRKSDAKAELQPIPKPKKIKITHSPSKATSFGPSTSTTTMISIPPIAAAGKPAPKLSITLKLGPRPAELEPYPCCLCVSMSREGLLKVLDPPVSRKDALDATGNPKVWTAHDFCASVVPETWIDEVDQDGVKQKVVFGVDGIVKDRWNLVRVFLFFYYPTLRFEFSCFGF